ATRPSRSGAPRAGRRSDELASGTSRATRFPLNGSAERRRDMHTARALILGSALAVVIAAADGPHVTGDPIAKRPRGTRRKKRLLQIDPDVLWLHGRTPLTSGAMSFCHEHAKPGWEERQPFI